MKKAAFALGLLLLTAACLPFTPVVPTPDNRPTVDNVGTAEAALKTAIAQTLTAQPTHTPVIAVSSPTESPSPEPLPSETATMTLTRAVDTPTIVPTDISAGTTSTNFPATLSIEIAGSSPTPGVLTYGTLPPAVPFASLTLNNRAKTQAYISLQVVTVEGGPTIIEYPVRGKIRIQAPVGQYLYVAWVGGRKMVGEFKLHREDDLDIFLYRDRVEIR